MGGTWRPRDTSPQGPASWQVPLISNLDDIALQKLLVTQQLGTLTTHLSPPRGGQDPKSRPNLSNHSSKACQPINCPFIAHENIALATLPLLLPF